jgi:anaerobic selenocysteine-containing dehydrogenase
VPRAARRAAGRQRRAPQGGRGIWNLPEGRINPKPGYHTVEMWKKFCTPTDKGGDIDTIWVQVTNPGQTLPNLHKLFAQAGSPTSS